VLANVLAHLRWVWDGLDAATWRNIGVMKLMFLAEDLQEAGGSEQWNPQSPHCIEAAEGFYLNISVTLQFVSAVFAVVRTFRNANYNYTHSPLVLQSQVASILA
jgi:hypothetical protein